MSAMDLQQSAGRLLERCRARGLRIVTAESCTGGLVAATLTAIAGSSDVVDSGFVTYSNAAKEAMLGVPAGTLKRHGAVSTQTAAAMAAGALRRSQADLSVAITGIPTDNASMIEIGTPSLALVLTNRSNLLLVK